MDHDVDQQPAELDLDYRLADFAPWSGEPFPQWAMRCTSYALWIIADRLANTAERIYELSDTLLDNCTPGDPE